MENPWKGIQHSEYMVHEMDVEAFEKHNARVQRKYQFLPFLAPEPWIGNLEASVLILLANPGATKENVEGVREVNPYRSEFAMKNLNQESMTYQHYFLDPKLASDPGGHWWLRTCKHLISESSLEIVANNLLSIEAVPYHSQNFTEPADAIPTQEFTINIVKNAMQRGAFIIGYRQRSFWEKSIPGLADYKRYSEAPKNIQTVWISSGNFPRDFQDISRAINLR